MMGKVDIDFVVSKWLVSMKRRDNINRRNIISRKGETFILECEYTEAFDYLSLCIIHVTPVTDPNICIKKLISSHLEESMSYSEIIKSIDLYLERGDYTLMSFEEKLGEINDILIKLAYVSPINKSKPIYKTLDTAIRDISNFYMSWSMVEDDN